jgi:hypothetical protein
VLLFFGQGFVSGGGGTSSNRLRENVRFPPIADIASRWFNVRVAKGGYLDDNPDDPDRPAWIEINFNRGGCVVLCVLIALASYGLYRLIF